MRTAIGSIGPALTDAGATGPKVGVRQETIVFWKGEYNPSLRLAHDVASA